MFKVTHKEQGTGQNPAYQYVDLYVKDRAEALEASTEYLIQGSKLYIIETAELFVLNKNEGAWCSAVDGTVLREV